MTYRWVDEAAKDIGVHETKGPKHEPRILEMIDWADGVQDGHYLQGIHDDETPWCASWLCGQFEKVGIKSPRSAWAQSFASWGQKLSGPADGCVVVFKWSATSGHVGLCVGRDKAGNLLILGGNQSDQVKVSAFGTGQVLAYRWPPGEALPPAVGAKWLPVSTVSGALQNKASTR